jgi:hypothetical protein
MAAARGHIEQAMVVYENAGNLPPVNRLRAFLDTLK